MLRFKDAEVIDIHLRGVLVTIKIDFPAAGSANGIIDEDDMRLLIGIVVCGV